MIDVAETILSQLGGNRFVVMTGATGFTKTENSLTCSLPGTITKDRLNRLRITLASDDTYTIETFRLRGINLAPLEKQEGIYVENLCATVSSLTGLALRL